MLNKGARVVTFFLLLATVLISTKSATAQYGQYGAYGPYGQGGPTYSILVDKMVGATSTTSKGGKASITYVDNLTSSDVKFKPGQTVSFRIKVKNTSGSKLTNVVVRDVLPSALEPIDTFKGYDSSTRTITLSNDLSLNAGEEVFFLVNAKVIAQDKLPANQGLICVNNKAFASNSQVADDDMSQFCIEKEVLGVKAQPNAGPGLGLGLLALQMLGLGTGIYLKKRV